MYETDSLTGTNVERSSKIETFVTPRSNVAYATTIKQRIGGALRVARDVSRTDSRLPRESRNENVANGATVSPDNSREVDIASTINTKNISGWIRNFSQPTQNSSWLLQTDSYSTNSTNTTYPRVNNKPVPLFPNISDINFNDKGYFDFSDSDFVGYVGNISDCYWNNDTLCSNLTSNSTGDPSEAVPFNYWILLLLIFPMFTLFGNILVVLAVYREKSLRTVTNYFIVSLAIADILVAVLVMPLAVWTEAYGGRWLLGDILCDAWVALDVCGCTASILNLTAISVDRFIAVTQPIKYAKHKNSKRVYIMLAMTWIVSVTICAPIALGMNYTDRRFETPELCIFYNSDFLIFSSMGSFYIPCVVMLVLYARIFWAIRQRAIKAARHRQCMNRPGLGGNRQTKVIENKAPVANTVSYSAEKFSTVGVPPRGSPLMPNSRTIMTEMTSVSHAGASDTPEESSQAAEAGIKSPLSDDTDQVNSADNKSTEPMLSPISDSHDSHCEFQDSGYSAPHTVEVVETQFIGTTSPTSPKALLTPPTRAPGCFKNGGASLAKKTKKQKSSISSPKKAITRFNFHMRHSKKKKDRSATRRERKATKTLAIVLGVFLICWVPFFTVNIITAFCIRYNLFESHPECNIDGNLFAFFVWLGYINSFMNPVIYTIFNIEFRKAFKKIIQDTFKRRNY